MRKICLLLVSGLLCMSLIANSQCTIRTVTTKWDAANSSNTWNWTTQFYDNVYIKNRSYTTIPSPFYNPNTTFQNPNLIFLQNAIVKDMSPDDGWELLVKDFGNASNLPATAVSNPFFAMYNRYQGLIRAFFMVIDPLSGTNNGATMSLMFEGGTPHNESALLSFADAVVKPIDQFGKNNIIRVPNKYSNEYDYWLFADFPVAYDPCTCLYTSQLTFTVQLIQTTNASLTAKLTGGLDGTIKQIIKPSPDGVQTGLFSNSALNWVNGAVNSANESYKSWGAVRDAGTGILDFLYKNNPPEKDNAKLNLDALYAGFKDIPYIGSILGLFDFLTGGGRKSATSAGPFAAQANLKLEVGGTIDGKLELSTVRGYRTINTPGSLSGGSGSGTPSYDNILGIFSLLETPKVEYVEYSRNWQSGTSYSYPNPNYDPNCMPTPDDPYLCDNNYPSLSSSIGVYDTKIRQYKVAAPIKYAVNPAAKLNLIDMKAALVIYDTQIDYSGALGTYGWNFPATFGNVAAYSTLNQKLNNMGYEYDNDKKFRTALVPLTCISYTSIAECLGASQGHPLTNPTDVYLKIQATFRRQDATSTTQDVVFVATYKTNITRSSSDPGNLTFDLTPTGRTGADGNSLPPYEYPNIYYYTPSAMIFPAPIAGIAGVQNPTYPSNCSGPLLPAQTEAEITAFCNNSSLYNPIASARVSYEDSYRPNQRTIQNKEILITNAPNPFKGQTEITFTLPQAATAKLTITDQEGKILKTLLDKSLAAGKHKIVYSNELPSGVYYCTLQTKGSRTTCKLIVINDYGN